MNNKTSATILEWITAKTNEAEGSTVAEIASELDLGASTVRSYVAKLVEDGFVTRDGDTLLAVDKHDETPTPDPAPVRRHGRAPGYRPPKTLERDEAVCAFLREQDSGRATLVAVASHLGIEKRFAYGALARLRSNGRVTKINTGTRTPVWELEEVNA